MTSLELLPYMLPIIFGAKALGLLLANRLAHRPASLPLVDTGERSTP